MPHRSLYADDPFMTALLKDFIDRLGGLVPLMREHRAKLEMEPLRRIFHQLKGSGRSYGFPHISAHARAAEESILANHPLDGLDEHLDALIGYIVDIEGFAEGAAKAKGPEGGASPSQNG